MKVGCSWANETVKWYFKLAMMPTFRSQKTREASSAKKSEKTVYYKDEAIAPFIK